MVKDPFALPFRPWQGAAVADFHFSTHEDLFLDFFFDESGKGRVSGWVAYLMPLHPNGHIVFSILFSVQVNLVFGSHPRNP